MAKSGFDTMELDGLPRSHSGSPRNKLIATLVVRRSPWIRPVEAMSEASPASHIPSNKVAINS